MILELSWCVPLWEFKANIMKLYEFFSQNNVDKDEKETDDQMLKDVMAFILDDNDIYKEKLLPLIHKHKKKVDDKELEKEYAQVIKDCCILFYKDQELKKDPNELFPKKMRKEMADMLMKVNKDHLSNPKKKQDEDS